MGIHGPWGRPILLWVLARSLPLSGRSFLLCLSGRWEEILGTGRNSGKSSQLPRVISLLRLILGEQLHPTPPSPRAVHTRVNPHYNPLRSISWFSYHR